MTQDTKRVFLTSIEQTHGRQLRRFLSSRMRGAAADVPDLIQEIFLRLLRIKDHEAIKNPQAYLYTVASHVLHQYTLRKSATPEKMAPLEVVSELQAQATAPDPADEVDMEQREALGAIRAAREHVLARGRNLRLRARWEALPVSGGRQGG